MGKPRQILVDTAATLYFKDNSLQSLQIGSRRNWQKQPEVKNSSQSQVSPISVVPGQERKVKFQVVPSFPNSDFCEFCFEVFLVY